MLDFLFRRLTAEPRGGTALFEAVTGLARRPHWYVEGHVPDTLDGRFAVLSTLIALVLVRLETEGTQGDAVSVALTERFIHVMESEHRELGLGDPTLGKTVRKLVGSLARRTQLWRQAANDGDWPTAAEKSLYRSAAPDSGVTHCAEALAQLWSELKRQSVGEIERGDLK